MSLRCASIEILESRICLAIAFLPAVQNPVGSISLVAAGDVTGDGKADLIAKGADGTVRLFDGLGNGKFNLQASAELPTVGPATGIVIADFNRDGKNDVAFSTGPSNLTIQSGLTVLMGHGDGTFEAPATYFPGADARALAAGDVNRDGKLDIVVADAGLWSPPPTAQAPTHGAGVMLGNGDGTFQMVRKIALVGPQTLVALSPPLNTVATFVPTLIALGGPLDSSATPFQHPAIYTAAMTASGAFVGSMFSPFVGTLSGLAVGDLNRDGRADIAALQTLPSTTTVGDASVYTFLAQGDGTFGQRAMVATDLTRAAGLSLADLNRDSRLDVAVAGVDVRTGGTTTGPVGTVAAMAGDGTGGLGAPRWFRTFTTPLSQTLADLNRDGLPDFLTGGPDGETTLLNARSTIVPITTTNTGLAKLPETTDRLIDLIP